MGRKRSTPKKDCGELAEVYEPTVQEQAVVSAHTERRQRKVHMPDLKVDSLEDGAVQLSIDHPSETTGAVLLMEALGIHDAYVVKGFIETLFNAGTIAQLPTSAEVNSLVKAVAGIEPRDQVEAMLAAQMVTVHQASMTFVKRLNQAGTSPQADSIARTLTRLTRTFTTQIEALRRYRTGGEQKVTVEHVTVNKGGQAIVGHVRHGVGGDEENGGTTS